ncbi:MAG TPA: class I SAM-dependent methyltransferase [Candidatus Omnitrophota bacterium]|nr:class I SAM-dependent methyltransferase [Candidatus Omnitrophota bacterium]
MIRWYVLGLINKLKLAVRNRLKRPPVGTEADFRNNLFGTLRAKWFEVPSSPAGRLKTADLLKLDDAALMEIWGKARASYLSGAQFLSGKGWYHELYGPALRGKKILDVGSGLGIDGITFAQGGAYVTFVDLAESNLALVKRICEGFSLRNVDFCYLESLDSLKSLGADYDFIFAMGSLHHAPFEAVSSEARELLRHLKTGGRWVQLAYPKSRWIREGFVPFDRWGEMTDGAGTPWAEWYDPAKILRLLKPGRFETVLCREFSGGSFIWFDLKYLGSGDGSWPLEI